MRPSRLAHRSQASSSGALPGQPEVGIPALADPGEVDVELGTDPQAIVLADQSAQHPWPLDEVDEQHRVRKIGLPAAPVEQDVNAGVRVHDAAPGRLDPAQLAPATARTSQP